MVVPLPVPNDRLDEIAVEIRETGARIIRDIAAMQRLCIEAQTICRDRKISFDKWCKSRQLGVGRTQIHNWINGFSNSARARPLVDTPGGCRRSFQNDDVTTAHEFARRLVSHFPMSGRVLDPCRGDGAFYDALPEPKDWCEIKQGRDFFDWKSPVDWIASNIPWSTEFYRPIARHAFQLADNVVLLARWHNATGTNARRRDWLDAGHGWREVIYVDWEDAGFRNPNGSEKSVEGFQLAAFWWQRGWTCGITETDWTRRGARQQHRQADERGRGER